MKIVTKVAVAAFAFALFTGSLPGTASARQVSLTRMLERNIAAVVTLSVEKTEKAPAVFGYADSSRVAQAYGHDLDLSSAKSSGSGFIVVHKGQKYIVTNAHVIEQASKGDGSVFAFSVNQTKYPVQLVGADSVFDIAVLKFATPPGKELGRLSFRAKEPRLGEQVFAIGNPLGGFPYSVSAGIIGGLNRVRGSVVGTPGYIQSTATTIWGNSGGPLLDRQGRVIGVNTQIEISQHPSVGKVVHPQLNFALESRVVSRLVSQIIEKGHVERAYLGIIFTQEAGAGAMAAADKLPEIAVLVPGSPAAAALAGMEKKTISAINGVPVKTLEQLFAELEKVRPHAKVKLKLGPEGLERTLTVGELDGAARRKDVRAFLRAMASLDADDADGGVVITKAKCDEPGEISCGRRSRTAIIKDGAAAGQPADGYSQRVVVADTSNDAGRAWRVSKLEDLETAMRLNALSGTLLLFAKPDTEESGTAIALRKGLFGKLKATIY